MPSDRDTQLRLHLACGGSRATAERQACFHQIVQLFNDWPPGPDRESAFAETRAAFHTWSPLFRDVHSGVGESLVYDDATRSVRDTLLLASTLRVRRYDDDDRAPPLSALLGSPHARDITMLRVSGTPLRLEELARGPGALEALVLNDALSDDPPWEQLADWPGLATLQFLQIGTASASCASERLWALLEHAPVLAGLHVRPRNFGAFMDRIDAHPAVAHRLDQITLQHTNLSDRDLQRFIAATGLDRLVTLDLRQNPRITCDGLAALRRAPHLGRGTVIIDRDCP